MAEAASAGIFSLTEPQHSPAISVPGPPVWARIRADLARAVTRAACKVARGEATSAASPPAVGGATARPPTALDAIHYRAALLGHSHHLSTSAALDAVACTAEMGVYLCAVVDSTATEEAALLAAHTNSLILAGCATPSHAAPPLLQVSPTVLMCRLQCRRCFLIQCLCFLLQRRTILRRRRALFRCMLRCHLSPPRRRQRQWMSAPVQDAGCACAV